MKGYLSIVYFCVFLFSPTGYADDITIPYKISGLEGVYTGEVLDGLPNGRGIFTHPSGRKYIGEFKDGRYHGQGTYTFPDGEKRVGQWKDGREYGQGTYIYLDGQKFVGKTRQGIGTYAGVLYGQDGKIIATIVRGNYGSYIGDKLDGLPHGQGKFTYGEKDGNKTEYVGQFKNGLFSGHGTWKDSYGHKLVGEWKDGKIDGQGAFTSDDGTTYVGEYKEGKKHGKGTRIWPNGKKYVGEWSINLEHGQGTTIFPNGETHVGEYDLGMRHGQGTYTFPDGEEYVGHWKDGKEHGQGTYTFPSGSKYVGHWKDGKEHGQGTYTLPDGQKYVGEYKEGVKHGQGTYTFPSGQKYVGQWEDDKEHGQGTYTHPSGREYIGEFKDGQYHGQGSLIWVRGGAKYVGHWKDGQLHGQGVLTVPSPMARTEKGEFRDGILWDGVIEDTSGETCYSSRKVRNGKTLLPTCTVHYDDGSKYVGEVNILGRPHGHGVREWPDGVKYVGEWKNNMKHGYGSFKFSDGETYVGDVRHGFPHGHGTYTYTDGSQYVGEWKEFKEHGYGVFTRADDGRVFSGEWTEGEYCPKCKRDWDNAHAAGQRGDYREVIRLLLTYAESGDMFAQGMVGVSYRELGQQSEAAKWYLRAAEQGSALAQYSLGLMYGRGEGVELNHTVAIKLLEQALLQKLGMAARVLSVIYYEGRGVPRDRSVAYAYQSIAAALGVERAKYLFDLEDEYNRVLGKSFYSDSAIAQGQVIAREIWANIEAYGFDRSGAGPDGSTEGAISTGSGFFINDLGYVVTNSHVVNGCDEINTILDDKKATSFIVINDVKNDLAVLKTGMEPESIAYFRSGRGIRAGEDVLAFGYPLESVLSDDLKGTKGMVNALSGMNNDTRMMQISAPVQPGNSGGPLLDQAGNIVGVVTAKMDAIMMAQLTDDIAQNVNFALKASLVRDMLEVKEIDYETASSKEEQNTADIFEQAKKFTVLVECFH